MAKHYVIDLKFEPHQVIEFNVTADGTPIIKEGSAFRGLRHLMELLAHLLHEHRMGRGPTPECRRCGQPLPPAHVEHLCPDIEGELFGDD